MNKRDVLGAALLPAAAVAVALVKGAAPVEASELDWRDELLGSLTYHMVYFPTEFESPIIMLDKDREKNRWKLVHFKNERKTNSVSYLEDNDKEFDTLEEAYKYAKALKMKYYT